MVRALVRSTSFDVGIPGAVTLSVDPGAALDDLTQRATDEAANALSLFYGAFDGLARALTGVERHDRGYVAREAVAADSRLGDRSVRTPAAAGPRG